MASPDRSLLASLAIESGEPVPCAGNMPLNLDDPQAVWFVEQGAADLFLVEKQGTAEQSALQYLLRAEAGRLLPGIARGAGETSFSLLAKGQEGTVLRRLPIGRLAEIRNTELVRQVDAWVEDVSAMLSRDIVPRPKFDVLAKSGQDLTVEAGTVAARRGVVWVAEPPPDAGLFLGLIDPTENAADGEAAGLLPLTPASWLTLMEAAQITTRSSDTLAEEGRLLPALERFHALAFSLEKLNRGIAVADQANLERERASSRRRDEEHARRRLFNLYGLKQEGQDEGEALLWQALQILGRHEGIGFQWPDGAAPSDAKVDVRDVLDASGIRGRSVRLASKDRWWLGDHGAMLAFRSDDGAPVVLLPGAFGRYRAIDPATRRRVRVTAERAAALRAEAWLFYRSLPAGRIGFRDLFRLVKRGLAADFARFATVGLLGSVLLLLPAVMVGFVVDEAIPAGEFGLLYAATTVLAMYAVLGALLHVVQGTALMRLEGRAAYRIEAAFWDRLLRLPVGVLRRYPSGDLAYRGMTFQTLRDAVRTMVADAVLTVVLFVPVFLLIFFYDAMLGMAMGIFGLLSLLAMTLLGLMQVAPYDRSVRAARRMSGRLFQMVAGIVKLRADDAEGTAFAELAENYREQKRADLKLGAYEEHLKAFGAALPLLAGAVLLLAAAFGGQALSTGDFLAIYFAFTLFQTGVARFGASFGAVAAIGPALGQLRPLLAENLETNAGGEAVKALNGEVAFDHVTFRYESDGPLILDDVTIRANPGEFVAIAGASGSGKSTLFRLALGMEQPTVGAVFYDGRNLRHLNLKQLRRHIGAVPQNVRLHPQDVWDNIAGGRPDITLEDIWQAARNASVARDIQGMPMRLMTNVGTSAGIVSGGEGQRIMIAHALIHNPSILLLDEATNWLDNENQAEIMATLARLPMTRIVIAHRLSTLRLADRIYVMQSGRVVQEGSYLGLMGKEGAFRDLARRQMA